MKSPQRLDQREQWTLDPPPAAFVKWRWTCWKGDGMALHVMRSSEFTTEAAERWERGAKVDKLPRNLGGYATIKQLWTHANNSDQSTRSIDFPTIDTWVIEFHRWPCRSLCGGIFVYRSDYGRTDGPTPPLVAVPRGSIVIDATALLASGGFAQSLSGFRMLPCLLLWPGFAINTVFYAAVLWVVFAFPFALRRRIRRKRGLCPACAYPVGLSYVCTECGRAVKPRAVSYEPRT